MNRFCLLIISLPFAALILVLGSCQRTPYAYLPASTGPYWHPAPRLTRMDTVPASADRPAARPRAAVAGTPARYQALPVAPGRGRTSFAGQQGPAPHQAVVMKPGRHEAAAQRIVSRPPDTDKPNPRKGLFWRLFWPGLFVLMATIAVITIVGAPAAAAGGTVALDIAKAFLVALPIYTAVVAGVAFVIRLIFPHDPTRE